MRATGIVRKIDELGRIVVPKDIRRSLNLKVGTSMEIYVNGNALILKEYSQLQNIKEEAIYISECLAKNLECDVLVTDLTCVIANWGKNTKQFENLHISKTLEKIITDRKLVIHNKLSNNSLQLFQIDLTEYKSIIVSPVVINGDCMGSIVCLSTNKDLTPNDAKCVNILNCLLVKKCDI